jgi:hypothetical protein
MARTAPLVPLERTESTGKTVHRCVPFHAKTPMYERTLNVFLCRVLLDRKEQQGSQDRLGRMESQVAHTFNRGLTTISRKNIN